MKWLGECLWNRVTEQGAYRSCGCTIGVCIPPACDSQSDGLSEGSRPIKQARGQNPRVVDRMHPAVVPSPSLNFLHGRRPSHACVIIRHDGNNLPVEPRPRRNHCQSSLNRLSGRRGVKCRRNKRRAPHLSVYTVGRMGHDCILICQLGRTAAIARVNVPKNIRTNGRTNPLSIWITCQARLRHPIALNKPTDCRTFRRIGLHHWKQRQPGGSDITSLEVSPSIQQEVEV